MHICNNSGCCNPNHLELGSDSKNIQYAIKCGRWNTSRKKLTEDQVKEIHTLYNEELKLHPIYKLNSEYKIKWRILEPIAQKYGISISNIRLIISGINWHHIWKEFHKKEENL